jgi:hypothetical protein
MRGDIQPFPELPPELHQDRPGHAITRTRVFALYAPLIVHHRPSLSLKKRVV